MKDLFMITWRIIMNNTCCNCGSCAHSNCAQKVSIFSSLGDDQLKNILNLITRKSFEKGSQVFSSGDISDSLYIVNSGSVKIYTYTKEGKEQILYLLTAGDFIGDLSLLKTNVFNFNAATLEDTHFCIIRKSDFDQLIKKSPDISLRIMEYAYDRIKGLEDLIQTLTTKDIDSRLAALLLNFSSSFGVQTKEGVEITFPLNREDMANYIGVTRETISRKLTHFQDDDLVELRGNKKLLIKDINRIREMI